LSWLLSFYVLCFSTIKLSWSLGGEAKILKDNIQQNMLVLLSVYDLKCIIVY